MDRRARLRTSLVWVAYAAAFVLTAGCGDSRVPPGSERDVGAGDTPIEVGDTVTLADLDTVGSDTTASSSTTLHESFYGGFAYSDARGERLLAVETLATPEDVRQAICQSGVWLRVEYEHYQDRAEASNGRQNSRNFDYDRGDLFRVEEGSAVAGETCFLVGPSLASLAAEAPPAVPQRQTDVPCDPAVSLLLALAKGRPVVSCSEQWIVKESSRLLVANFEPRGDSALAAIVWADGDDLTFHDLEGVRDRWGNVWRVDDNGVLYIEDFYVLLAIDAVSAKVVIMGWDGFEGQSNWLMRAPAGEDQFESLVRGYRYLMGV